MDEKENNQIDEAGDIGEDDLVIPLDDLPENNNYVSDDEDQQSTSTYVVSVTLLFRFNMYCFQIFWC